MMREYAVRLFAAINFLPLTPAFCFPSAPQGDGDSQTASGLNEEDLLSTEGLMKVLRNFELLRDRSIALLSSFMS